MLNVTFSIRSVLTFYDGLLVIRSAMSRRSPTRLIVGVIIFIIAAVAIRYFSGSLMDGLRSLHESGGPAH
jgi:small-conductance mechanosensitive channel